MALAGSPSGSPTAQARVCQCPCGCQRPVNLQTFTIAGSFLACHLCSNEHLDLMSLMPQCSLCEQLRQLTPARCCPNHANEYGIILPNDILAMSPDDLTATIERLRLEREQAGTASRHRPIVTARDAVTAMTRGRLTAADVMRMVGEGRFTAEEVDQCLSTMLPT